MPFWRATCTGSRTRASGLLNIGEEDIKGTEELRDAHRRLALAPINYRGFVEGDDIFSGDVDVVVTDGFAGNVALKTSEGLARFISGVMREEFTRGAVRKLAAVAATPALRALKRRLDPRSYNGASMVGLDGIVIKSHGGADRVAFANAVRVAMTEAQERRSGADRGDAGAVRRRGLQRKSRRGAVLIRPSLQSRCQPWAFFAAALRRCIRSMSCSRRRVKPPACRIRIRAGAARLRLAKATEILVCLELVLELPEHQFHHDRVVEQADPRDLVRDDVLRVTGVGERREHRAALVLSQRPVRIGQHRRAGSRSSSDAR